MSKANMRQIIFKIKTDIRFHSNSFIQTNSEECNLMQIAASDKLESKIR